LCKRFITIHYFINIDVIFTISLNNERLAEYMKNIDKPHGMHLNKEMMLLNSIAGKFKRHPLQINSLSEADAEILNLEKNLSDHLVVKIDGLYEELQQRLYEDPYQIGWMSVTVTVSDLAAVGSDPIGILLAFQFPLEYINDKKWFDAFQSGVEDACAAYNVYILGGDSNFGVALSVTTSGIATLSDSGPMMRSGIKPGQLLYSTGKPGLGNAYAFGKLIDRNFKIDYLPKARLNESKVIRNFAENCMDTSDGLFPALSVLSEINGIGFRLNGDTSEIINENAKEICQKTNLPNWIMMAGPHGDYELLFTINPEDKNSFESSCSENSISYIHLGSVINESKIEFFSENRLIECHPSVIANMYNDANGDVKKYLELLINQNITW
jgi:thiamine-monophosphate kinase